jgi:hypothetical protein
MTAQIDPLALMRIKNLQLRAKAVVDGFYNGPNHEDYNEEPANSVDWRRTCLLLVDITDSVNVHTDDFDRVRSDLKLIKWPLSLENMVPDGTHALNGYASWVPKHALLNNLPMCHLRLHPTLDWLRLVVSETRLILHSANGQAPRESKREPAPPSSVETERVDDSYSDTTDSYGSSEEESLAVETAHCPRLRSSANRCWPKPKPLQQPQVLRGAVREFQHHLHLSVPDIFMKLTL